MPPTKNLPSPVDLPTERMRIIVRLLLDDREMTQKELSELTGIEETRISNIMNSKLTFYLNETDAIAEALEVDSALLIGDPEIVLTKIREAREEP